MCVKDISVGYKTEIHSRVGVRVREQEICLPEFRALLINGKQRKRRKRTNKARKRDDTRPVYCRHRLRNARVSSSFIVNSASSSRERSMRARVKSSMKMAITQWRSNVYFHSLAPTVLKIVPRKITWNLRAPLYPCSCRCTQNSPSSLFFSLSLSDSPRPSLRSSFRIVIPRHREIPGRLFDSATMKWTWFRARSILAWINLFRLI